MNKYLQIPVAGAEPIQIPIGSGLICDGGVTATSFVIYAIDSTFSYTFTGTGMTVKMRDAFNEALVYAAQTNWTKSVSTVQIPTGEAIASYVVNNGL